MRRFLKRTIYCLVPALAAAVVLGVPTAAPDLGLQNVNLSCNDGTNQNLALDTQSLTALTDAVGAITLYAAGDPALACGLQTSASGSPNKDYAVGGGRAGLFSCTGNPALLETNFALNARVDAASNGTAGTGTFNATIPPSAAAACPLPEDRQGGHFNGRIDCVNVSSSATAQATLQVTHATGGFSASGFEGTELRVNVFDSGLPGGTGDRISVRSASIPCNFGPFSATRPVDNGNISIHQAS
jgi:hypothetical protein